MSTPEVTITLGRSGKVVKRKRANFGQSLSYHSKRRRVTAKENVGHDDKPGFLLERNYPPHKLIQREKIKRKYFGEPASSASELQRGLQSQSNGRFQGDPYREAIRNITYIGSSRNVSSTVTRDDITQRCTTCPVYNSGCMLPPTHKTELQKETCIRSIDPRSSQHGYSHSHSFSGPTRSTVPARVVPYTESERVRPMAHIPSPSGFLHRNLSMVEIPVTVAGLLNSLGLGKYAVHFQADEVDMSALKLMTEKDLKDLGILMGPRKKILHALSTLLKKH